MNWKWRMAVLLFVAVPAFSGWPLDRPAPELVNGLSLWTVGYWILVNFCLLGLVGAARYQLFVAVAAMIALPVVFGGAAVSALLALTVAADAAITDSIRYTKLCLTMLTVIPLALGMVALLPVLQWENNLLRSSGGIGPFAKAALMFVRVFNHIIFFVIPNILEVMHEERQDLWRATRSQPQSARGLKTGNVDDTVRRFNRSRATLRFITYMCVEGICAAVQYIPLWAMEIAQLPTRRAKRRQP
jgi:hypothetical protein